MKYLTTVCMMSGHSPIYPQKPSGQTPLMLASGKGHKAMVKALLSTGIEDKDARNNVSTSRFLQIKDRVRYLECFAYT